jgi:hypothetical protein
MTVGNCPQLWRFDNLHSALLANTAALAQLIRAGEQLMSTGDESLIETNSEFVETACAKGA